MNKNIALSVALVALTIASLTIFIPTSAVSQKQETAGIALPDSISKILMNSCGTCHTDG
jgi:hypothetical protein